MSYSVWALPVIAALIGWLTNFLAIKMLFHPRNPVSILGIRFQGIFPKRQRQLAEKIGTMVGEELVSMDDLKGKLNDVGGQEEVLEVVDAKMDVFLNEKLPAKMPMLSMIMNPDLKNIIKGTLMAEIQDVMPQVVEQYADRVAEKINIKEMVREKVEAFSIEKLEDILFAIMKKEFKFIELVGAVLGFLVGCIQVFLLWMGW